MLTVLPNGLIAIRSQHPAEETVGRLEAAMQGKGLTIFARIDHSGEAAKVGLRMPFARVMVFGSPKAGTPLMIAAPSVAIDLPLKVLVQENDAGEVSVYFNSPEYLRERHQIPEELLPNIAGVGVLLQKAIE
jgi:uncharacterized protein (DUF302 family)